MCSIRQCVSPWGVKENTFTHVLTHSCVLTGSMDQLWPLTPVSSRMNTWAELWLIPACLRTASTSQWLSWLLNFVFGKENENLLFYRRHSILKWFNILSSNVWSHSAAYFPLLWVVSPSPQTSLLPVSRSTTGSTNKYFFLKPQKAESHKNKTSVQPRKAGFVPCSMWGGTSNADNLKLIKGKGRYIEPVHKEMLYKQTENATLPAVVPFD